LTEYIPFSLAHDDVTTLENELSNSLEMNDHGEQDEEIDTNETTMVNNPLESINDHIGVRNENRNEIFEINNEGTRNIEPVENDRDDLRNENKIDNEQINHKIPNNMIDNANDECERQINEERDIGPNTDADTIAGMEQRYGPPSSHYNLRLRKARDYLHLHTTLEHIALTQYNLKRGLQTFGQAGIEAVKKITTVT
jgi:hypothetical protein